MGNKSSSGEGFHTEEGEQRQEKLEDLYIIENKKLGRGHYATVWQAKHKETQRKVAIKRIKKALSDEKRLRSEISILRQAGTHKHIVELIDVFETPREVQLVMELCTGGELFDRLASKGAYSEADCARHIRDMTSAILFLHSKGIVHRDLKPENILLSSPDDKEAVVKVADFGLAKIITGTELKTKCGTWGYSAPEMASGSTVAFGYDFKVDSWSLGTILYILLCGYHPFDPQGTSTDNEMMKAITSCQYDFNDEAWQGVSENGKNLIQNLLVLDPTRRLSMEQVLDHPWLQGSIAVSPLSPRIHKDLAKYRANAREKKAAFDFDETALE